MSIPRADYGPEVHLNGAAYVDPTVRLYGKISLGKGASVWPYTVMRAESYEIRVGDYTNVQDFSMVHIAFDGPTIIGDYCSITHHCTIHGCEIGDNTLVGIGAVIMDGCKIGRNCIIGGGSFLKERTEIPDNSIVVGTPAKVVKRKNNWVANRMNALYYYRNAQHYQVGLHRAWHGPENHKFAAETLERLHKEFDELLRKGQEVLHE